MTFKQFMEDNLMVCDLTHDELIGLHDDLVRNYNVEICSQGTDEFNTFNEVMETLDF